MGSEAADFGEGERGWAGLVRISWASRISRSDERDLGGFKYGAAPEGRIVDKEPDGAGGGALRAGGDGCGVVVVAVDVDDVDVG